MKFTFIIILFVTTSFSQLASSEARGIIRIIERMFPSTPANQNMDKNTERSISSEQGTFERVDSKAGGKSDEVASRNSGKNAGSDSSDDLDEDGVEDEYLSEYDENGDASTSSEQDRLSDNEKEDLEISRLEKESEKNRRSELVIALLSEKKTMRLGLQVFNQSCSKCHGTFQYSKPHMSRRAYRLSKRKSSRKSSRRSKVTARKNRSTNPKIKDIPPEIDLQTMLYKFGKSEEIIERHLVEGLPVMPGHRFENLTKEELRAVTRFVMSIN